MKKEMIGILFLFVLVGDVSADNIYVDQTLTSDCTSGNYNAELRDCSGSDGDAYNTVEEVLWGDQGSNPPYSNDPPYSVGDTIYLRGGEYDESYGMYFNSPSWHGANFGIPLTRNGDSWEEGHYTTIASYPGEWAILDGSGTVDNGGLCTIGNLENSGYSISYYKFDRLEIKGGSAGGLCINHGPIWVTNCYIHDNGKGDQGDGNRGGIRTLRLGDSIIEYNYFEDNSGAADHNKAHIVVFSDYLYYNYNIDDCNKNNTIRYNYFAGTEGTSVGIKDKASQFLGDGGQAGFMDDFTYKELGNDIHHNIFRDVTTAVMGRQYFEQIHNNICDGAVIDGEDGARLDPVYRINVYNNLVIGSIIKNTIGYDLNFPELDLGWGCWNNILSSPPVLDYSPAIGIATLQCYGVGCDQETAQYYWEDTDIDRNLIYKPSSSSRQIGLPHTYYLYKSTRWLNVPSFNSEFGFNNYLSYEDGLFLGTSGAEQYITNPDFDLGDGEHTIADGGLGGQHPYLDDVIIPSYVGAVNPDDSAWVEGVLSLGDLDGGVPTNLLNAELGVDPVWIEGSGVEIQSCSEQGGECCASGYSCIGGDYAYSTDCGTSCCIDGGSCIQDEVDPYCSDGICNGDENCSTCPEDCGACQTHEADTNEDGQLSVLEISAYISRWILGQVSMSDLIDAIKIWKAQ